MTRAVPQLAIDFTMRAEGRPAAVYRDKAGYLTGGHGHRLTESEIATMPLGTPVSDQQDAAWLQTDYAAAAWRLTSRIKDTVIADLTDHEYAALLDFVFNVGAGPTWTIWKLLNRELWDQIPGQLLRFDKVKHADGTVEEVQGLKNRRLAEIALWNTPDLAAACTLAEACKSPLPSSYTRDAITPPTPAPPKPLNTASLLAKGAGAAASVGAAASAVQEQVKPVADLSPHLHQVLVVAAGVAVAATCTGLLIHHLQAKRALQ